jgi:CRP-like cAMP-binding protein
MVLANLMTGNMPGSRHDGTRYKPALLRWPNGATPGWLSCRQSRQPRPPGTARRTAMSNPLVRKLSNYVDLPEDDRRALEALAQAPKAVAAHTDLIREGDPTDGVHLILSGSACRYKILPDGQRQIMGYFIPGDLCDQRIFILKRMDHCIGTVIPATVAVIAAQTMIDLTDRHPRIARALWWSTLVDEAITREWVVNVGQRDASERVAHLICELFVRVRAVGLAEEMSFDFPVTQTELADTTGLTTVHTNRMLRELRTEGLISVKGREQPRTAPYRHGCMASVHRTIVALGGCPTRPPQPWARCPTAKRRGQLERRRHARSGRSARAPGAHRQVPRAAAGPCPLGPSLSAARTA